MFSLCFTSSGPYMYLNYYFQDFIMAYLWAYFWTFRSIFRSIFEKYPWRFNRVRFSKRLSAVAKVRTRPLPPPERRDRRALRPTVGPLTAPLRAPLGQLVHSVERVRRLERRLHAGVRSKHVTFVGQRRQRFNRHVHRELVRLQVAHAHRRAESHVI